jgi:hypothetical protein
MMLTALPALVLFATGPGLPALDIPGGLELIAKGDGFLVHANSVAPGFALSHTATATGERKWLLLSGVPFRPGPPMGFDCISTEQRIVGIASDTERLYVLVRTRHAPPAFMTPPDPGGRRHATPTFIDGGIQYGPPTYRLAVYRLADGTALHSLPIREGDFPKEPLPETIKLGPLATKANGIACFGVTFTFKGTELLEQRSEKK